MHPIDAACPRTGRRLTYGECLRLAPPEHLTESERRDLAAWAEWDREHHTEASVLEAMVGRRVVLRRTFRTWAEDVQAGAAHRSPGTSRPRRDVYRWTRGTVLHVVARFGDRLLALTHAGPAAHDPPTALLLRADWIRAVEELPRFCVAEGDA